MKIIYVATSVIPADKANSYQVMKMCESFTRLNVGVELIIPVRFGGVVEKRDPFEYYGIKERFTIKRIFSLDLIPFQKYIGHLGFWIQNISFSFLTLVYLIFKRRDFIYSRDRFTLFFLSLFKKNLLYEIHSLPNKIKFYDKFLYKRVKFIIAVTSHLKKILIKDLKINENKIFVAPDAVDLKIYEQIKESKEDLREKLNLPIDKKLICYVGQLYTKGKEKGLGTMLMSLKILKDEGMRNLVMLVVGGKKEDFKIYEERAKEIGLNENDFIFIEQVPFTEAPKYEKASDILVIPFPKEKHYAYYASPLKLFEYMASNNPIIASELPSLREILDKNNSILVEPDNPEAMAKGIKKLLSDAELAQKISEQAYKDVQEYTWNNRAKKILDFICAE